MKQKLTQEQPQETKLLLDLMRRTKHQMPQFKISEKTIKEYIHAFGVILEYCAQHNISCYEKEALDALVLEKHMAYENQIIGRMQYQNVRKSVALLQEVHDTGVLTWGCLPSWNAKNLTSQFSIAVEQYCSHKAHFLAKSTIAVYKNSIRQFLFCIENMGIYNLEGITRAMINDAMTILAPRYPGGMKNVFPAVRSFLQFLHENKTISNELHMALPEHCAPRRTIRHGFSEDEMKSLLQATDCSTCIGKRDYAMMLLAVQTGLRVVDIVTLTFQNIDWHKSELQIVQHKTGKPLTLPLEPAVGNAIADYILDGRPDSDCSAIFLSSHPPFLGLHNRSASSIVARYMKKCDIDSQTIPRRGFHSFRRSFGANLLQSEIPLEMLSELLGHSHIDASRPYIAVDELGLRNCCLSLSELEMKEGAIK